MPNETNTNNKPDERKIDVLFLIGLAFSMIGFAYSIIKFSNL
ncbi:MAG TPA: hypothetical protein VN698_10505 [Bacteroidia bacterium]|nr:hypothetical protein [Bacteroidia bacterium]